MLDVIIPSAKLIPEELQKIGKLPAVIYPVNQRIVFDYIYNQYRNVDSRFTVIGGENCGLLYKALSRYDSNKVDIMNLDTISDLGHTVYVALKDEQETVVINFGDTIVLEDVYDKNTDAIFCALDDVSSTWTFFEEEEGILTQIYDKINIAEKIQKKLFVGVFRISNVKDFRESLEYAFDNPITDISSFYTALQIYSRRHPFSFVYTDHWLDIGHADKYYSSKLEVNAREFNHISIDKNRGILRKTSDNIEKFIDEIKWYLKLPSDVEYVRPRIFEYSTDYSMPYISMEYYAYHTIHELYLYGDLNRNQWSDIFKRIRFVLQDFSRYSVQGEGILDSLSDIYINKTIERVNELKKSSEFISFFEKSMTINKIKYKGMDYILDILKEKIPKLLFDSDKFCIIHGDLCFSNIMVDSNYSFVKIIDPRGKFGKFDIYGDRRYELAKLFHSIDGKYDYIIKDAFKVEYSSEDAVISYEIIESPRAFDLYELFLDSFKSEIGDKLRKIELIEALLFLSMIPLHKENLSHQMVMLATGVEILNRVINVTD